MTDDPTPLRHAPRSWFSLYIRLGGWATLVFAGLTVLALALSFLLHWSATRYDREGIQAEAEILDTWARVTENTDGGTTTTHYIRFLFRVRGDRHEVERSVSRAYFSRVSDGDIVPIRYLESDPDRFEYEVGTNSRWADRLWLATLLPLGLGLGTHLWFRSATR